MIEFATYLFAFIVGHALADFAFQSSVMAENKAPSAKTKLQKYVPWYYWMGSHALIHGGAVAMITLSVPLGIAEAVCHFLIDLGKCNRKYGIHVDQALHLLCKIAWAALMVWYV